MESVPPGTNRTGQLNRRAMGALYEARARHWLEQQGLHFIAANVQFKGGEIDLVMRDAQSWVFVEVRYRRNADFGSAQASVTRSKQRRVINAATCWLIQQKRMLHQERCRFDVVAITGDQLDWIPDAFNAGA